MLKVREEEKELPPLIQIIPEAECGTSTCTIRTTNQTEKVRVQKALPQPLADEVQRHAEAQDNLLTICRPYGATGQRKNKPKRWKIEPLFHPLGGGVPSSAVDPDRLDRVSEEDEDETRSDDGPENDDGSSEIATGPGCITQPEPEMHDEPSHRDDLDGGEIAPQPEEEDVIPQPIPFPDGNNSAR